MTLLIILFVAILSISFLCSILEAILLSLNMSYINYVAEKNKKGGALLKKIKENIDKSISSILIINTLSNTLGATMIGIQAARVFEGGNSVFIVSVVFTFLILFLSEIIPKTIGALYHKELAIPAARIINIMSILSYPLVIISSLITSKIGNTKTNDGLSKDELLHNILIGEKNGVISDKESDIIENTLASSVCKLHSILTPRSVVYAIDINEKISNILEDAKIYQHSRIPIYENNIDNIIGVMLSKNLFKIALENKDITNKTLKEVYDSQNKQKDSDKKTNKDKRKNLLIGSISNMNENIPVMKALSFFVQKKEHILIVTDKYGQTEGIVTLEDCMEQVLGVEIVDESDVIEDMQVLAANKMKAKREQEQK